VAPGDERQSDAGPRQRLLSRLRRCGTRPPTAPIHSSLISIQTSATPTRRIAGPPPGQYSPRRRCDPKAPHSAQFQSGTGHRTSNTERRTPNAEVSSGGWSGLVHARSWPCVCSSTFRVGRSMSSVGLGRSRCGPNDCRPRLRAPPAAAGPRAGAPLRAGPRGAGDSRPAGRCGVAPRSSSRHTRCARPPYHSPPAPGCAALPEAYPMAGLPIPGAAWGTCRRLGDRCGDGQWTPQQRADGRA
jgi:hypothetical protein